MVSARAFEMDLKAKGKVSLNVGDIAKIGQLIPQQKIRTRYKYNF
jgi:hypothetical protein